MKASVLTDALKKDWDWCQQSISKVLLKSYSLEKGRFLEMGEGIPLKRTETDGGEEYWWYVKMLKGSYLFIFISDLNITKDW